MKRITMVLVLFTAACGGGAEPMPATTPVDPPQESPGSAGAPPAESPGNPGASSGAGTPCSQEVALVCPEGLVDGCHKQATAWHICMQPSTGSDQPCSASEIARQCDEGLVDACFTSPPASNFHICVAK